MAVIPVPKSKEQAYSSSWQEPIEDEVLSETIHDLLYYLGVTAKYTGFSYTTCALILTVHHPERLQLITKWLYPDVARICFADWRNVERGIRASAGIAWELRPAQLISISNIALASRPSNVKFLSILTSYLQSNRMG